MRSVSLWALLLVAMLLPAAAGARTQVRFAVVIGANVGDPSEKPLVFAEDDARQFAQAMTRFGGVADENLILLEGRTPAQVVRSLEAMGRRVQAATTAGSEVLLFVYYSGHADAQALHLQTERLSFERFKALTNGAGAQLAVMVIDACRSGAMTRLKGGKPAAPFVIEADDRLDNEGLAIITSAAADEDAQESDRLRGGVFSHHFLVGLLGAADVSRDETVTLTEAYRYAYQQTLRTTSRAPVVQHPTFSFRVRGREDLVLTRLTSDVGMGRVELSDPGEWLFLPAERGNVIELSNQSRISLRVRPGRYTVRRRHAGRVSEQQIAVPGTTPVRVRAAAMKPVPYAASVRRGLTPKAAPSWGLIAGSALRSSVDGFGTTWQGILGVRLDAKFATVQAQLGYGQIGAQSASVQTTQRTAGLELAAWKLFDWGDWAVGAGLAVGLDGTWQRFETSGRAPDRNALVARAGPTAHLEYALTRGLSLTVRGGPEVLFRPAVKPAAIAQMSLGVVWYVDH